MITSKNSEGYFISESKLAIIAWRRSKLGHLFTKPDNSIAISCIKKQSYY